MSEKIIENILQTPFGFKVEELTINGYNYEITYSWKKYISININPKKFIIEKPAKFQIRKMPLLSLISRYPQYSLSGKRTLFTEKLLINQYTRALLRFQSSKITSSNNQVSYTAKLKKKNIDQLDVIIEYFKKLVISTQ